MTAAGAMMTQRCTIERDSTAGYSDSVNFSVLGSPVACRLWASTGREALDLEKIAVVEDLRVIVPVDTDITPLDRIHGVADRRGTILDSRILEVKTVMRQMDHLEVVLQVLDH